MAEKTNNDCVRKVLLKEILRKKPYLEELIKESKEEIISTNPFYVMIPLNGSACYHCNGHKTGCNEYKPYTEANHVRTA